MKTALWIVCAALALLWTGGAWLSAALTDAAATLVASGDAAAVGRSVAQWQGPSWLSLWLDPRWLQAAQATLAWAIDQLQSLGPALGALVGWLVPLIWLVWGIGLAAMLSLAGGAHLLIGRWQRRQPRPA